LFEIAFFWVDPASKPTTKTLLYLPARSVASFMAQIDYVEFL